VSARGQGTLHRFRIPLARARVSFVDLHYKTALINILGDHRLLINGGYWAYQGSVKKIQGLLVVNGVQLAPRANNLSGGVLEIRDGKARLLASDRALDPSGATLAIQCNPRLVDQGRVIPKLEAARLAARTALCLRDDGTTLDAYLTHDDTRTSLAELGAFLVEEGCQFALNLDGGPSTAAAFRDGESLLTIGLGEALPYGLAFD
jgi:exopolysaccharide biosynthesis protein